MEHRYDLVRELDEEMNGGKRKMEMSIENYMIPPPFWKLGASIEKYEKEVRCEKEERCVTQYPTNLVNRSNRVRVKNVFTGVLFEFTIMSNSARFLGATHNNMRWGIKDEVARVFCVGRDEFVF